MCFSELQGGSRGFCDDLGVLEKLVTRRPEILIIDKLRDQVRSCFMNLAFQLVSGIDANL